ncbi:antA/AntB antirepressor family protein [Bartonella henselae]|uniref:Anti-repressor protein n=3 Tax=Bartonella TaxID=773 RepID=X5MEN3_BARHN|nr:antA/AntB antirepressor family protein [Bartonella henselae]OLL52830.1 antirepressor [Bartonella henselae]OLL55975.1 antirepressor [Bartonella henselae]UJM32729.1 antA/AntB antirepressor family protein [Bartonella henselae]UJM42981.1 antA/AntB antirepressor family protein [Bartonella henselae]CDO46349.1 anti-repressor protein [Bartonella henselae]
MAQYLIDIHKTTIDGDIVQTVNARELHAFLEIGKDFSTWIKDRINKYNLLENQDYLVFTNFGENLQGGRPSKDYHLTLSVAKELSMVENNKKGREARLYFIECERRLKQTAAQQIAAPQVDYSKPEALLGVLNHLQSQIEQKDHVIAELAPKAEALEGLKRSDGLFGLIEAAKMLEVRPKDLTDYLRKHDWVYRRAPGAPLLPYQDKIKKGFMDCPAITIQRPDGTEKVLPSTKITSRGLACLREQIHGGVQ